MSIQKEYEVIRFIEHGGKCRVVMDCARGRLLIHYLKCGDNFTKEQILYWIRTIIEELEKYHRCKKDQCYRYLNPYSVLITEEGTLLLLDLSAQSNEFVIQNMQRPAMREHFVKPVVHIRESSRLSLDLYSIGKTMQFVLAYTELQVDFSKREEYLLSKVIEKCLGDNPRKKYDNLKQVQAELPKSGLLKKQLEKLQHKKKI